MLKDTEAYSSFSVDDIEAARSFYGGTLGLDVDATPMEFLELKLGGGQHVMVYPKPNHQPATFTVLNFRVDDIEKAVDELIAAGITFERYDNIPQISQDAKGIARDTFGQIAWFTDPAGNVISVIQAA